MLAKTLGVKKLIIAINKMDDPTVSCPCPASARLPAGLAHSVTRRCIACTGKTRHQHTHARTCVQSLAHTRSHADTIPRRARV